ncbi:MAG: sialidase family protein [Armatimonadota bacterium]|nr:sialidase family protein [Armatimonadota bacterium]
MRLRRSLAVACVTAVVLYGISSAWRLIIAQADSDSGVPRQVMGGLETRMDATGDDTPFTGDRPQDVERVGAGIDGVPLALPNGKVMMLLTHGARGSQYLAARFSTDNGRTWGESRKLFDFPANGGSFSNGPALVSKNGTIHVFGMEMYGFDFNDRQKSKCHLWHSRSRDGGRTWSAARKVDFGLNYTGAVNSAFQLRSGRIICPVSGLSDRRIGPWVSLAPYSDDDGATWHAPKQQITMNTGAPDWYESGAVEPVGIGLKDGRAWLLPRSQDGYQWESFSKDGGITWTPVRHTRFVNNQSAMALMRLADGRLILFWNNCGPEGVHGIYAERLVMCAAISSNEGKTWRGYREIARRTSPGEISYPFITQTRDGYVLLATDGNLWRVRPDFLLNRDMTEDFSAGIRRWSTLAAKGVFAAPDPDGGKGRVLSMVKPDVGAPSAACMSFPYGVRGDIAIQVRMEPGFQGAHFTLSDHYDLPRLPRDGSFPIAITPSGRVMIIAAGGAWVDTPGDLTAGKWHELRLRWNCGQGCAVLSLDRTEIAQMEQFVRTPGVCYLRLCSTAPTVDTAGLYIRSVKVRTSD